jgi:hypothetical protein
MRKEEGARSETGSSITTGTHSGREEATMPTTSA